jgi:hypothetical protein
MILEVMMNENVESPSNKEAIAKEYIAFLEAADKGERALRSYVKSAVRGQIGHPLNPLYTKLFTSRDPAKNDKAVISKYGLVDDKGNPLKEDQISAKLDEKQFKSHKLYGDTLKKCVQENLLQSPPYEVGEMIYWTMECFRMALPGYEEDHGDLKKEIAAIKKYMAG